MISYVEKRTDKRAEFNEEIKYKLIGDDTSNIQLDFNKAAAKNVSCGGLCLVMSHKINEGNVIRVEIPVNNNTRQIKAFCEVQWCKENEAGLFDIGASFIALKEDDLKYLNEYITSHIS
ncbi:MAG: PilZ domain-containing protein [Candidatus Goldbacteria bacterium]|nr:PilZ domain-containing protein [Candidatus Goldiibacteriota bacterium]